jgi:hypothetical protein
MLSINPVLSGTQGNCKGTAEEWLGTKTDTNGGRNAKLFFCF